MADQASEGLLSPFLKRQRISAVLPHIKGRVLDVGCGNGGLAAHVDSTNYVGIDIDSTSIEAARANHPAHTFHQLFRFDGGDFDTVTALAVIEHVSDPVDFLLGLKQNLKPDPLALIVCTTPHPSMDWVHWAGSRVGLFSHSANEEHEDLLGKNRLIEVGRAAGLRVVSYRRFLFGANQVVAYTHDAL